MRQPAGGLSPPRPLPRFLADMYGLSRTSNDNRQPVREPGPFRELDCLGGVLAPDLLEAAVQRARTLDVGAERVLIQWGVIDEDAYLERLAFHLGATAGWPHDLKNRVEVSTRDVPHAVEHEMVPLDADGQDVLAIAPRGFTARRLTQLADVRPDLARRVCLVPARRLSGLLVTHAGRALAHSACFGLRDCFPGLSAGPSLSRADRWRRLLQYAGGILILAALLGLLPTPMAAGGQAALALWFLAFAALRTTGAMLPGPQAGHPARDADETLPVYSIIAALYREARSVPRLMDAINALDYPPEKLDVILVIEPDDLATRLAIAQLGAMPHLRVLIAPDAGPRTKPKALNWALPFARGGLTAVFDAEDRPDPSQLRAAVRAFRRHGPEVACVQASLCIDNESHTWLSRMFAAEYAGQFDVFLPGLAALRFPLPLGGSSNHFRTHVLRQVGGWDAHNVTEDADLGFRLARFGYRAVTLDSTTHEEAPLQFHAWLRQRSRWMKGWMQTWSVHMRAPCRLWREAGPRGFLSLNLLIGGNVLTALACPILLGKFLLYLASAATGSAVPAFLSGALMPLHLAAIIAGCLSTLAIGLLGMARRGQLRHAGILLLTPLYWACLSIAAWRALYQLIREPYRWEKTEHGLARRTKPPCETTAKSVRCADSGRFVRDSASGQPRPLRASA
jgi:cellulose synthase/poly-beta-1,6-N-acetylglucosamine synthase-like glycosyltransferase